MIKIVTIDLDGTLFDPVKNVSDDNIKAIKKCQEMGVHIVIATGRPISGVKPLLDKLGLNTNNDYVILYNGAKIINCGTNELIYSSTIKGSDVKELYREACRLNVDFHAFRKNGELITPRHNPYTEVEATINKVEDHIHDIVSLDDNDEFLKAMMVGDEDNVTRIMNEVNPIYPNRFSMLRSSKIFLEFLDKKTNKGEALKSLAKHLNIDIKNTMAIGDAGNDIPMIKAAGIGVAMGNSFKEVIDIADYVTTSNTESGVARALEKFIINEK
ncbi:MAG: Cof-type HAD-IIB family hydrolase [Acholeplasmatales bacterium]|nr:Cof-type HAD-IIB family hydrolase [Acholeplasmatales bacterium]